MKRLFFFLILASVTLPARQAEPTQQLILQNLNWAFPMPDKTLPPGEDSDKPLQHVPGSTATSAEQQINPYNPPDWFPDEHPPMPEVVRHGRGGVVQACSYCHTAAGFGHPQSANLTGLSADYLMSQIVDFKSGARVAPLWIRSQRP